MNWAKLGMTSLVLGFLLAFLNTYIAAPISAYLSGQNAMIVSGIVLAVSILLVGIARDYFPPLKNLTQL